jgi:hypothetical protein
VMPGRELRTTSDALLRDLELLTALEEEKRGLPVGDPRVRELADRIEQLAVQVLGSSAHQRELTETIADEVDDAEQTPSIDEVRRPIHEVLAEWRAAERRLAAAESGSVEGSEAAALVEHWRREYRRAREAATD